MIEEFLNLTGVHVSPNYYRDIIEPAYNTHNIDKTEFCAEWLKDNKRSIVKAIGSDFANICLENCINRAIKSENEDIRSKLNAKEKELTRVNTALSTSEYKAGNLALEIDNLRECLTFHVDSNEALEKDYKELKVELEKYKGMEVELIRLKAALYDKMTEGGAA